MLRRAARQIPALLSSDAVGRQFRVTGTYLAASMLW